MVGCEVSAGVPGQPGIVLDFSSNCRSLFLTAGVCGIAERDHMEHKLDELQQQGSRLGPANLANHDQVSQLQHEVLQLTAENEVSCNLLTSE